MLSTSQLHTTQVLPGHARKANAKLHKSPNQFLFSKTEKNFEEEENVMPMVSTKCQCLSKW